MLAHAKNLLIVLSVAGWVSGGCGKDDSTSSDATTGSATQTSEEPSVSETWMTSEATTAGTSDTSDVTTGCGFSPCGACQDGCTPSDSCVDGQWMCNCICMDTDTDTDTDTDSGGDGDVVCVPEEGEEPKFPSFDKLCDSPEDCALVFHTVDCCGDAEAWGIHVNEVPDFEAAEAVCDSQYPDCGCPMGPISADDGNAAGPDQIAVDCQMGACWTYVP